MFEVVRGGCYAMLIDFIWWVDSVFGDVLSTLLLLRLQHDKIENIQYGQIALAPFECRSSFRHLFYLFFYYQSYYVTFCHESEFIVIFLLSSNGWIICICVCVCTCVSVCKCLCVWDDRRPTNTRQSLNVRCVPHTELRDRVWLPWLIKCVRTLMCATTLSTLPFWRNDRTREI